MRTLVLSLLAKVCLFTLLKYKPWLRENNISKIAQFPEEISGRKPVTLSFLKDCQRTFR